MEYYGLDGMEWTGLDLIDMEWNGSFHILSLISFLICLLINQAFDYFPYTVFWKLPFYITP